jgi:ribosomal protein L11 methyltransferase
MTVAITPLASLAEPFSVVVANIIHDTLLELAPDLARLTAPHGQMILSGILDGPQAASIIDHFRALGFSLERQEQKKEWAALLLVKKQSYHP